MPSHLLKKTFTKSEPQLTAQGHGCWNRSPNAYNLNSFISGSSYFINHQVHVVFSVRLPLLLTPRYLMLNIKKTQTQKVSSPESKRFKRTYPSTDLTFLWTSRTRVWACHQTSKLDRMHPVLIPTPYYEVQGRHATLDTRKLLTGQIVLNKEIFLIADFFKPVLQLWNLY